MTLDAEVRHVQRLEVIPVMPLEPATASTPGTAPGPRHQTELLAERGSVTRGACPDASRSERVEADVEVSAEAGELGVLTIPSAFFHDV